MIDYEAEQRRAAAARSYTTQAVLTLLLYLLFWLPGVLANLAFWHAAREDQRVSGVEPAGKDYLDVMLILFVALPLLGGAALVALLALGGVLQALGVH